MNPVELFPGHLKFEDPSSLIKGISGPAKKEKKMQVCLELTKMES